MRKRAYITIGLVLVAGTYLVFQNFKSFEPERIGADQTGESSFQTLETQPAAPAYVPSAEEKAEREQLMAGTAAAYVNPEGSLVDLDSLDPKLILDRRLTDLGDGTIERLSLIDGGGSYPLHRVEEKLKYDADRETYVVAFQYRMVADHILVKLREGVDAAELEEMNQRFGTEILKPTVFANKYIVQLPEATLDGVMEYSELFENEQDAVERVNRNGIRGVCATPNDQYYSSLQWGPKKIGCPAAWDIETGDLNVIVAVIDTGVDLDHADLAAHIWENPGEAGALSNNGLDDDGNGYPDDWRGWDFGNGDNDPDDNGDGYPSASGYGHGTHCSGIVGAIGNNSYRIAGVCWNVTIMALKPFEYFSSDDALYVYDHNAEAAMKYAADNGAWITSNSYGGTGGSAGDYLDGVAYLKSKGVLMFAAAGNGGDDGVGDNNDSYPHWPSNVNLDNVISVGSSTESDTLSGFSNYGATSVDVFAPGSSIISLYPNEGYRTWSGTSMACPMAAGAAALLYSQDTNLTWQICKASLMDTVYEGSAYAGKCVSEGRLSLSAAMGQVDLGDNDGDGIPDDWEQFFYGTITGADPAAMAANGINTVMEAYLAGISPVSPDARFEVEEFTDHGLGKHVLQWTEAEERMYTIYWTYNLKYVDFTPIGTNYSGGAFTDLIHNAESVGFYRIEAGLVPEE